MKELKIERLSHDLRGMAYADGVTWFVEGALPGETILARELARRQQLVDAEAVDILSAATGRVVPACEYYGRCGGCSLQHVEHAEQVLLKQQILLGQLARIGKVKPATVAAPLLSSPWAYRRRARLACKWSSQEKHLALGLRERHSQQIVEIRHCAVLVPALEVLLEPLRSCLSRWSQPRQLGHVELLAADNGAGVLLRVLAQPSEVDVALLHGLSVTTGASVFLQLEEKRAPHYLCGPQQSLSVGHECSGAVLDCMPGDFVQGNAAVNEQLVGAVLAAIQPVATDVVLEAFCGLGNFTVPLASRVASVVALEVSEVMLARARQSAVAGTIRWQACDLDAFDPAALQLPQANKILLDPPRDGAQAFCRSMPVDAVERVVYVSCNPSTLARDAAILAERGFALDRIALVDMFPQTSHIEALAVFLRDEKLARKLKKEKAAKAGAMQKRLRR